MRSNVFILSLLLVLNFGCAKQTEDFECFWRGGCDDSANSSTEQNSSSTSCTVAGIENSSETAEFTIADGESDSVTCDAGYTKSGSISCSNTEATGTITCAPDSCTISAVADSDATAEFSLAHGATDYISCDGGFTKVGSISCSLGVTSGSVSCMNSNDCLIASGVANSNKTSSYVVKNGETTNDADSLVTCDAGYTKVGSISCATGTTTIVSPLSCEQNCTLDAIANSDHTSSGSIAHGGSQLVTCDTGYTASATDETFNCTSGTISESLSCDAVTCSQDIKHLTTENVTDTISSVYNGGASSVSISSCASGFKPTATEVTCTPDGTFDTTVTCAFVDWLVQLHGNNLFTSIESGTCTTSGTTFVECESNAGTWTGDGIDFRTSDYHNTFTADADGNIFSFGSNNGNDGIIIKMDPDGNVFWRKEYTAATTGINYSNLQDIFRDSVAVTKTVAGKKVTEVYFSIQTYSNFASNADKGSCSDPTLTSKTSCDDALATWTVGTSLDCAVGKINFDGDVQWIVQLDDSDATVGDNSKSDYCGSIAVNGDTLVVGGYSTGTIEEGGPNIESSGQDAFVAKLNASDGSIYWVKQVPEDGACSGGTSSGSEVSKSECDGVSGTWTPAETDALCMGVAIDDSANVYCAGTAVGGSMKPGVSAVGDIDLFIAVFESDGNHLSTYEHGVSGKNTLLNHMMIDDIDGDSVVIYGAGKTDGLIQVSDVRAGADTDDDGFIMMADFNTATPAFSNVVYEQLVDADITDASGDESCRRLALDNDKNLYALCYATGATLGEENDGGGKHPLILKLARASTGNITVKGKKQYGDNLQSATATTGVLQINDTESGDLIEEYTNLSDGEGEQLGGSIMVNADGSIYFGSNLNFAFAGDRSSSGDIAPSNGDSIGLKSGSETDHDPWVMKIQDCEGVLQLGSSDCSP